MNEEVDVAVSIVGFVAEHQPNIIDFVLRDAFGENWHFYEKAPVISDVYLEEHSTYPVPASVRCTLLRRYVDGNGHMLAVIDTDRPWHVEALEGEHVFTVRADQLSLPKYLENDVTDVARLPTYELTDLECDHAETWFKSQRVAMRIGDTAARQWAYVVLPDGSLIAIGRKHNSESAAAILYSGRLFVGFGNCLAVFTYPGLKPVFSSDRLHPRFDDFVHIEGREIIILNEFGFTGITMDGAIRWQRLFDDWISSFGINGNNIAGEFSDGKKFEFTIPDET